MSDDPVSRLEWYIAESFQAYRSASVAESMEGLAFRLKNLATDARREADSAPDGSKDLVAASAMFDAFNQAMDMAEAEAEFFRDWERKIREKLGRFEL